MGHVPGRRFGEGLEALIGQDGVGEPPVGRIGLATHKAPVLEALDQMRQPRQGRVGEVGYHPQVGIAPQLLIDRPGQPGHHPHHGQPGVHFRGGQPLHQRFLGTLICSFGHRPKIPITR